MAIEWSFVLQYFKIPKPLYCQYFLIFLGYCIWVNPIETVAYLNKYTHIQARVRVSF